MKLIKLQVWKILKKTSLDKNIELTENPRFNIWKKYP